jgi:4-amino-4-deoxy-L-arabinose transferase-like glycosyltransferase
MMRWWVILGIVLALLAGASLRLIWPADIEYKADEAWTFEHSRDAELPWLGMPSSVDIPNPGMSLWVFMLLERLSGAADPPALARAVQIVNVAALVLLAGFAFFHVPRGEREAWLWAAALVAVNPLAVLFHRKIWPPCVLPLVTLAMLYGWWYRQRRGPAFLWGLLGICLGQIHMAGFFFAGGFVLWALLFDRPWSQRVAWRSWLLGCVLGALPMLPWLIHLAAHPSDRPINPHRWVHACELKFWVRWCTESFGLGINYTFGPYFREFLRYPLLGGRSTYLVAGLHGFVAGLLLLLLSRALVQLWRQRQRWSALWIGRGSASAFTQNAALWGFGSLLTLSCFSIHRHYMIVLFPLEFLWVARLALSPDTRPQSLRLGRSLLLSLCLAQFFLSANMLAFIHTRQNFAGTEYGVPYGAQCAGRPFRKS